MAQAYTSVHNTGASVPKWNNEKVEYSYSNQCFWLSVIEYLKNVKGEPYTFEDFQRFLRRSDSPCNGIHKQVDLEDHYATIKYITEFFEVMILVFVSLDGKTIDCTHCFKIGDENYMNIVPIVLYHNHFELIESIGNVKNIYMNRNNSLTNTIVGFLETYPTFYQFPNTCFEQSCNESLKSYSPTNSISSDDHEYFQTVHEIEEEENLKRMVEEISKCEIDKYLKDNLKFQEEINELSFQNLLNYQTLHTGLLNNTSALEERIRQTIAEIENLEKEIKLNIETIEYIKRSMHRH
jgi:hypothetical protein